jgi:PAS domain-containing protein
VRSRARRHPNQAPRGLADTVLAFARAAERAGRPGADLSPGSLLRGDIDGEYPVVLAVTDTTIGRLRAESVVSSDRWARLMAGSVLGLGFGGVALVTVILGPVGAVIRRNRLRQAQSERDRVDAAAYVEQLLDSIDLAVLATDATGAQQTVNSSARRLFAVTAAGPVTDHLLPRQWQLFRLGHESPLTPDELPPGLARLGHDVPATELRLCRSTAASAPSAG